MENKVKVKIIGREYTLGTDNSPEYTLNLAEELDEKMNGMLSESQTLSGLDVAILCALDAMDEADNIRLQLGEYVSAANRAQSGAESHRKEISALKKRIEELEDRLNQKSVF